VRRLAESVRLGGERERERERTPALVRNRRPDTRVRAPEVFDVAEAPEDAAAAAAAADVRGIKRFAKCSM
jgi:hypothetical protein